MNWKKMMAVGLAAVSMMAFVTGCGGDAKKANTELPKKVVIGLDDSFPPMGFKDEKGEIIDKARVRGYPFNLFLDSDLNLKKTVPGHLGAEQISKFIEK